MEEEESRKEERKYVSFEFLAKKRIEEALPVERDEGGHEGFRGTRFDHELQRLKREWRDYAFDDDRRLGVGNRVVIKKGTPIQVVSGFVIEDYITTDDITGVLTKETESYPYDTRPLSKRTGGMRWREYTRGLFKVSVDLPPVESKSIVESVMKKVDILIPNDMVELAESTERPTG